MFYLISTCIACLVGIIYYFLDLEKISIIHSLLLWNLVVGIGFFGIFNFVGHAIKSELVAKKIGWISNGFQKELGFVSLGIGINGILCYWFRDGLWIGTIIITTIFLVGAGFLHISEMKNKGNFNVGNTIIVIPDFLIPLLLVALFIIDSSI
ncbi:DUF6790 family protein [Spirochaeta cellobiosiphila]|uniref:DUF6790 family protein n=1 Tax=Spirochaeta cellobiosiphila TaxID=504483 RepID=UPI000410B34B|nr:DUF6790 family protein [Spirochaeta cellobiosiphila]